MTSKHQMIYLKNKSFNNFKFLHESVIAQFVYYSILIIKKLNFTVNFYQTSI